jgi:hypothetical protein
MALKAWFWGHALNHQSINPSIHQQVYDAAEKQSRMLSGLRKALETR